MKLAVELDQDSAGYASIHRQGCRDLSDPEPIGEASTHADALALCLEVTGWDDADSCRFAPCARLPR